MSTERRRELGTGNEPEGTLEVRDLDRLRLLADPLRLRLVHAFAEKARTTKQVADLLGLPATRLYHHVAQLADAGLIRLTATRPVRGTVEKYYRAVARRFVASPGAFAKGAEADAVGRLAAQVIDQARADVEVLRARTTAGDADAEACEPLLARATVIAPRQRLVELRDRMLEWLAELEAMEDEDGDRETEESTPLAYSLTLAFLPTDTKD